MRAPEKSMRTRKEQGTEKHQITVVTSFLSITVLYVNGLKMSIKLHIPANWIKNNKNQDNIHLFFVKRNKNRLAKSHLKHKDLYSKETELESSKSRCTHI